VACYLHPVLAAVLAAADTLVPLAIGLILLIAILRGSTETCERVFRFAPLDHQFALNYGTLQLPGRLEHRDRLWAHAVYAGPGPQETSHPEDRASI